MCKLPNTDFHYRLVSSYQVYVVRVNFFLLLCIIVRYFYYAALLPRRGPHIASHSVCLSVRLSVRPVIVTERHVAPPSELQ